MSETSKAWVHRGFEDFARGQFGSGGDNLYVNARGVIETIHRTDVNGDGFVDIILPNAHGYIERAPTWIYTQQKGKGETWPRQELPNDSGWMSRVVDLDGDGYPDLVVVNGENGVTSELHSYVYWGGPGGLTGERTELPTAGAYDVAAVDLAGNRLLSLLFPSAWVDHHNRGKSRLVQVYAQVAPRRFEDVSERYGLAGAAAVSIACDDLNGDGRKDLVVCNYREEFEYDTESFVYWGTEDGFDTRSPLRLPTHYALQVALADLNGDGRKEILFAGGDRMYIYWGGPEGFSAERSTGIPTYCQGNGHLADINNDGWLDFLYGDSRDYLGVFLGGPDGFGAEPDWKIPLEGTDVATVSSINSADLDGDGWLDLIVDVMGHYTRKPSGFFLLYGGPGGFARDKIEFHQMPPSSVRSCLADINQDGYLDLLIPAYSTQFSRELPAHIFFGGKEGFDFENPLVIPCDSSCAFAAIDITGNGYPDILAVCHRNDLGHKVDSLLFWNGPEGLAFDRVTRLPGLGPHLASSRDFGNAYTREPVEYYVSPPYNLASQRPVCIGWEAETPGKTALKFQLRRAETESALEAAPWQGPDGEGTSYERNGQEIGQVPVRAQWIQYRALFLYTDGCHSPRLREVRIDLT